MQSATPAYTCRAGAPFQPLLYTLTALCHPLYPQVFEECRALCMGLAARGIDWRQQGLRGTVGICISLAAKLFTNLMSRCDNIAVAMTARGFQGPDAHALRDGAPPAPPRLLPSLADTALLLCLGGLAAATVLVL